MRACVHEYVGDNVYTVTCDINKDLSCQVLHPIFSQDLGAWVRAGESMCMLMCMRKKNETMSIVAVWFSLRSGRLTGYYDLLWPRGRSAERNGALTVMSAPEKTISLFCTQCSESFLQSHCFRLHATFNCLNLLGPVKGRLEHCLHHHLPGRAFMTSRRQEGRGGQELQETGNKIWGMFWQVLIDYTLNWASKKDDEL